MIILKGRCLADFCMHHDYPLALLIYCCLNYLVNVYLCYYFVLFNIPLFVGIDAGIDAIKKAMSPQCSLENNIMFSCAELFVRIQLCGRSVVTFKLQYRDLIMNTTCTYPN